MILTWQKVWEQGVSVGETKGWRQIWHIRSSSTCDEDRVSNIFTLHCQYGSVVAVRLGFCSI